MEPWKWDLFFGSLPYVARGLLITIKITLLGSLLAYALGLLFAVLLRARVPVLHLVLRAFVEAVRSTPLLVQIFVLFWLMPQLTGVKLGAETTGVLALGVHYACYTAEVYRAGIDAVPRGQWEAAAALSLPRSRVWLGVVLPQAVPRVIPALGNYTISMFKEVPLLLAIGVLDVLNRAKEFGADNYRVIEAYTMAGLVFLVLSYPASVLVRRLERRVAHS